MEVLQLPYVRLDGSTGEGGSPCSGSLACTQLMAAEGQLHPLSLHNVLLSLATGFSTHPHPSLNSGGCAAGHGGPLQSQRRRVRLPAVHARWRAGPQPDGCRHSHPARCGDRAAQAGGRGTVWEAATAPPPRTICCAPEKPLMGPPCADVDFNPQIDRQAEDRCHRLGQTRPVKVRPLPVAAIIAAAALLGMEWDVWGVLACYWACVASKHVSLPHPGSASLCPLPHHPSCRCTA